MVFSAQFHAPSMIHQIQHCAAPHTRRQFGSGWPIRFRARSRRRRPRAVRVTVGDHTHARTAARSVDQRSAHLSRRPDRTSGRSAHPRPHRFRCPASCRRIDPRAASPSGAVACVCHARRWRHQGRSDSLVFSTGTGDRVGQGRSLGLTARGVASRRRRLALSRPAGGGLSPRNAGHDGRHQPVDDRAVGSYPPSRG